MSDASMRMEGAAGSPAEFVGLDTPAAGSKAISVVIVTPEATVLETKADFVALPLFDGELGVAPMHAPMIGRLGYGELRIMRNGVAERYYIDGGFVQVADNVVSVLTDRAAPAISLNATTAQERLDEARTRPSSTPELFAARERDQLRARAQIRVAGKN